MPVYAPDVSNADALDFTAIIYDESVPTHEEVRARAMLMPPVDTRCLLKHAALISVLRLAYALLNADGIAPPRYGAKHSEYTLGVTYHPGFRAFYFTDGPPRGCRCRCARDSGQARFRELPDYLTCGLSISIISLDCRGHFYVYSCRLRAPIIARGPIFGWPAKEEPLDMTMRDATVI